MGEFKSNLGISKGGGGKTYKISTGSKSIEKITRQGLPEDVLKRLAARRPPVDNSGEADFRFGKPSKFSLTEGEAPTNPKYTFGGFPEDEPVPPEPELLVFREIKKEMEEVRVENPDDPEQYIITKRRVWSIFDGPDGLYRQFVWDNSDID